MLVVVFYPLLQVSREDLPPTNATSSDRRVQQMPKEVVGLLKNRGPNSIVVTLNAALAKIDQAGRPRM
jgi:hypothetical protein